MNWNKLQEMQLALDNAILQAKPEMSAEERFNKTLVALSVEVSEVANCAEHFKFWKDNKGKVDEKRFEEKVSYSQAKGGNYSTGFYYDKLNDMKLATWHEAHKLTLVEECSDALHFILSLANQMGYKIDSHYNELEETESGESIFLNLVFRISLLQRYDSDGFGESDEVTTQVIINNYFQYIEKLGITTQELEQAYYEKNKVNYERLREGY